MAPKSKQIARRARASKMKEETSETLRLNIYEGQKMLQHNSPLCTLVARVGDSVSSVKTQIHDIEGIAPDHQRISKAIDYEGGAQLGDDYHLLASDFHWGFVVQFPMQIFVSLLSGVTLTIDVTRSDSIDEVESKVWDLLSLTPPELTQRQLVRMLHNTKMQKVVTSPFAKLIFGTTLLSITRTIASYGISNGASLTCMFEKAEDDDEP